MDELRNIVDETERRITFGTVLTDTMRKFMRRMSGYVNISDYTNETLQNEYFDRPTSRIFKEIQRGQFDSHLYRAGTVDDAAFMRYRSLFIFAVYNFQFNTNHMEGLEHLNDNPDHIVRRDGNIEVLTTLRNVNQALVGTGDVLPQVLPNGEQIRVSVAETVRTGLTDKLNISFTAKEGRIFSYLYPRGFTINEKREKQRAKRISLDARFRNCDDWLFYQYNDIHRLFHNQKNRYNAN